MNLNKLSDIVDDLWMRTIYARQRVEIKTEDALSVYGHDEGTYEEHLTIREKDEIYQNIYKSIGGENASPYARLKAAMDYWCALWFWPIDKADLFPTRQEFFMELSLILEGGISAAVKKNTMLGQMEIQYNTQGQFAGFGTQGSELANEIQSQISGLGVVNLEQIRELYPRLQIADTIAKQQKFMHWELEFANLFYERGGFDLVIGNPPWLKMTWNEQAMLADKNPMFAVKKLNAAQTATIRNNELKNKILRTFYMSEYISMSGTQNYLNASGNYQLLRGQQTNLYKCFIPLAWLIGQKKGISAYVHPDSIFDDPNGDLLRKFVYRKLRRHYQLINELRLFAEVDHHMTFSLNVYGNDETDSFELISNLFTTSTIEESYEGVNEGEVPGIKDKDGKWETKGHKERVIRVAKNELLVFSNLFDGNNQWETARLPVIHTVEFLDVLKCFAQQEKTIGNMGNMVASSEMWHEANDQKNGVIVRNVHFPESLADAIFSGPHIGIANPLFKASRKKCVLNSDYDKIDLTAVADNYIQRVNYSVATNRIHYNSKITTTPWGNKFNEQYMVCSRKMLNINGERTLVTSILPPHTAFINGIFGMCFKEKTSIIAGAIASLCYDFYLRITGKSNGRLDTFAAFPVLDKSKYANCIALRSLRLNCLTQNYSKLWEKEYEEEFSKDSWAKRDERLEHNPIHKVGKTWVYESALRLDYNRREALIELDVLVAMALGMTFQQLKTIYRIQFPVLQSYEADTWYDRNGRIVFTVNRGLVGVGFSRKEWEEIRQEKEGVFTQNITDDTMPGGPIERTIEYVAPFDRCDREKDYEEVWANFEKRFADQEGGIL